MYGYGSKKDEINQDMDVFCALLIYLNKSIEPRDQASTIWIFNKRRCIILAKVSCSILLVLSQ